MSIIILAVIFLVTWILSYIFVGRIRHWSEHLHILDYPNERSSHETPVPRGGGGAIVFVTLLGLWIVKSIEPSLLKTDWLIYFSAGGFLVGGISLLDDLYTIRNTIRFFVHGIVAVMIIFGIGYIDEISLISSNSIQLGYAGIFLTFIFIAGLINAYNFMDGIDGIAGVQAIIAGIGWAIIGYIYSEPLLLLPGILTAAGSIGFLFYNWHPAKIFMGDVGSAFLGYSFAAVSVVAVQRDPVLLYAGILLVWPFIFDTFYTLCKRLVRGENIFEAHRSHLYQRLVIAGWSHKTVTILYGLLALTGWIPVGLIIWQFYLWYLILFFIPLLLFISLIVVTTSSEKNISAESITL